MIRSQWRVGPPIPSHAISFACVRRRFLRQPVVHFWPDAECRRVYPCFQPGSPDFPLRVVHDELFVARSKRRIINQDVGDAPTGPIRNQFIGEVCCRSYTMISKYRTDLCFKPFTRHRHHRPLYIERRHAGAAVAIPHDLCQARIEPDLSAAHMHDVRLLSGLMCCVRPPTACGTPVAADRSSQPDVSRSSICDRQAF